MKEETNKYTRTLIDPPDGWRYGFPKRLPNHITTQSSLREWLEKEGYPSNDLDFAMEHSRYIQYVDEPHRIVEEEE